MAMTSNSTITPTTTKYLNTTANSTASTITPSTTTTVNTAEASDDSFRTAVIVLGVMVALLLVAGVILLCCLRKKSRRPSVDVEKSSMSDYLLSTSTLSSSSHETAEKVVASRGTRTVPKVDIACQADFNLPKQWTANVDSQTVEWSPLTRTSDIGCQAVDMIRTAEKGCQVKALIEKVNAKCQTESVIERRNKQTNTKPAPLTWDIGIQTRKPPAKDRTVQVDQLPKKPSLKTSACQTYITSGEIDRLKKKAFELESDSKSAGSPDDVSQHFRRQSPPRSRKRTRRKRYRHSKKEIEYRPRSSDSYNGKSPTQLDAAILKSEDEFDTKGTTAVQDLVPVASVDHTRYGFPVVATNSKVKQKKRRKSEVRSVIYKSFSATDRVEERIWRYLAKYSPQLKKKKRKIKKFSS